MPGGKLMKDDRHPAVISADKAVRIASDSMKAVDLRTVPMAKKLVHKDIRLQLEEIKRLLQEA
jgi:hypothetical protein